MFQHCLTESKLARVRFTVSAAIVTVTFDFQPSGASTALSSTVQIAIGASIVLGILVLILLVMLIRSQRKLRKTAFDFKSLVQSTDLGVDGERNIPREVKREKVNIIETLGKGNFGEVSKGTLTEMTGLPGFLVAIKVLHQSVDAASARVALLEEAAVMAQFDHPNVVRLIGVVTLGDPLLVILEYTGR